MLYKIKQYFRKIGFRYIGKNVIIKKGYFANKSQISISSNSYIGPNAYWDGKGGIIIHSNVIIGPRSTFWTYNHNYKSEEFLPYDSVDILKPIEIKSNVWIGLNVSINPGVTIGEGAIIAMGSVVTSNIPPLAIVGGNPATIIKYREKKLYERVKSKNNFSYLENKHLMK